MVVNLSIEILKKKKEELERQQQELIDLIKSKHPQFYTWSIENNINLKDLSLYAANIAAAFSLTINSLGTPLSDLQFDAKKEILDKKPSSSVRSLIIDENVKPIELAELYGLSKSEKAALVYKRYGTLINTTAEKYQLDPKLILTTILLESGGNTYAIRHEPHINDASYGLGQILYGTARLIGFEGAATDLYDPKVNIDLIGKYHRRNMDVYGPDLTAEQLIVAYNAGSPYSSPHPGHLQRFNRWFHEARHLIV